MSEINNNNNSSSSSVEESVSSSSTSTTKSTSSPTSNTDNPPDSLAGSSTGNSCSSSTNSSDSSGTNTIQTNTITTATTSPTTNVCGRNNSRQNDVSGTAEMGLQNAFELLDIDSEHWKNQNEKIVDCLKSPVAGHFELRGGCGAPSSSPSTTPPITGVGVSPAAMVSISGDEPLTGCISSLQKLKLCQECRKTDSCKCGGKVHLKKKTVSSSMLDKFNLARSSSSPRGVIKEARFRPHPSDSTEKSVLRASRLKFLSQLNAAKRAKHTANKSTPTVKFDDTNIFGQYSESSANFAYLAQKASDNFQKMPAVDNHPNAPQFSVYQNNLSYDFSTNNGFGVNGQPDLRLSTSPTSSVVSNSNNTVPFSIDQTCSLQARLDDMSVNELACYFEEYVHIPKKMSEMAEMMYR